MREADGIDAQFNVTFHGTSPKRVVEKLNGKSEEDIARVLSQLVELGANTPQSEALVPKPIAEALTESVNGRHACIPWPQ